MYLAEAIKERDYLTKAIEFLTKFIGNVLVLSDGSSYRSVKSLVDSKREELNELYTRYQQLDVAISRVKAKTIIKVNDTELSIMDACTIRDIMKDKEQKLEFIFNTVMENDFEVLELSGLIDDLENLSLDIKSIESKIEYAQWYTEVT